MFLAADGRGEDGANQIVIVVQHSLEHTFKEDSLSSRKWIEIMHVSCCNTKHSRRILTGLDLSSINQYAYIYETIVALFWKLRHSMLILFEISSSRRCHQRGFKRFVILSVDVSSFKDQQSNCLVVAMITQCFVVLYD